MANSQFVAVTWSPQQLLDEDTLDQINNNILYLNNQMVDGSYMSLNGGVTDVGLKLLCGRTMIPGRADDNATVTVSFARMFTAGTIPVVTTGVVAPGTRAELTHVLDGIGQDHPSHQGFRVRIRLNTPQNKKDQLTKPIYLNWIAMGL